MWSFVLYFSALCGVADEGKKLPQAAMKALLTLPLPENFENGSTVENESADIKPVVLWSACYIQKETTVCLRPDLSIEISLL